MRALPWRMNYRALVVVLVLLSQLSIWNPGLAQTSEGTPIAAPRCQTGAPVQEEEPNNQPPGQQTLSSASCAEGEFGDQDTDFYAWDLSAEDSMQRWTVEVDGPIEHSIVVAVYRVEFGDDGVTPQSATELAKHTVLGGVAHAAIADLLWRPGRYFVGVSSTGPGPYRLVTRPGAPLPDDFDAEPNDDVESAVTVSGEFAASGDRVGSIDVIAWMLSDSDATNRFDLHFQTYVEDAITLTVRDQHGQAIAEWRTDAQGLVRAYGIGLPPGTYTIEIPADSEGFTPYALALTGTGAGASDREAEPNESQATASSIALSSDTTVINGGLTTLTAAYQDIDAYRFSVDETHAGRLVDIKLFWRGGQERELCLLDAAGESLACNGGEKNATLYDVVLQPGDYAVIIQGVAAPADQYLLRIDVTASLPAGFEQEPNNSFAAASSLDTSTAAPSGTGQLVPSDRDYFRITITGEPQMWLAVAEGPGVDRLEAIDAGEAVVASAARNAETNRALIGDLLLRPGDHWFTVIGQSGEYTLRLLPLGPPSPTAELEPNGTVDSAERLFPGGEKTGRLLDTDDIDVYRFSLLAPEHVALRLEPPADGLIDMTIQWGAARLAGVGGSTVPGEPLVYEAYLQPGDYIVSVEATQASEDEYRLSLERGDPFTLPPDTEPNDSPAEARPLALDVTITGSAQPRSSSDDIDWYLLDGSSEVRQVSLVVEPEAEAGLRADILALRAGELPETPLAITEPDESGIGGVLDLPAGQPIAIGISGEGGYRLTVESRGGTAGGDAPVVSAPLPVMVTVSAPETPVAAYWLDAQRLDTTVTLTNTGTASVDLQLDAHVSDARWWVTFDQLALTLAAGETTNVHAQLRVGADAWADRPVQVTVRAQDATGRHATGALEITPDRDAPPLNPDTGWTLVPELNGGLNVAWSGFGAQPVEEDPDQYANEAMLFDGLAAHTLGWRRFAEDLLTEESLEITVDLAGESAIPVAGVVLNPFGDVGEPAAGVREFEVQLSLDGQSFETVLSGELSALARDQAFVLDQPIEARFARLRVVSNQLSTYSYVVLGEWKVIAQPGWQFSDDQSVLAPALPPEAVPTESAGGTAAAPEGAGFDLAAPERGGHLVSALPQFTSPEVAEGLFVPGGGEQMPLEPGTDGTWVIGFQHERAAQITALSLAFPETTDSDEPRIGTVEVSVSLTSPVGPWESIGTLNLDPADPDSYVLALQSPTWVRFVRFTATPILLPDADPAVRVWVDYPAQVRIFERPADDTYLSALAEWGQDSRLGIYELLNETVAPDLDPDAGSNAVEATELTLGEARHDSVWTERDEDWYSVLVPADATLLSFTVNGDPTVDVALTLMDDAGNEVELTSDDGQQQRTYEAQVTPGRRYTVRVIKPPTSLMVVFDMSGSMGAYLPMIFNGVGVYSEAVVPGLEVVNFLPFGEGPILPEMSGDSLALQMAITNYPRTASSSDAESSLLDALGQLEGQPGTKAILLLTDAESGSYGVMGELWESLDTINPRIFSVQIGAGSDIASQQDFMQDWADANRGIYQYVRAQSDVDVAFDRTATVLRRPSIYGLTVTATAPPPTPTPEPTNTPLPTSTPVPTDTPLPTDTPMPEATATPTTEPEPGQIRVVPDRGSVQGPAPIAPDVSVALILDTSGSMLQGLDASTRAEVAKDALTDLVTNTLPTGTNVSLRAFGVTPDSCETRLVVDRQPLDAQAMAAQIQALEVVNLVRTPIGASLEAVAGDLGSDPGPKIVVLVTDGEETCGGDAEAAIRSLVAQGIDVHVNIVGFALEDEALRDQFRRWARIGNGQYIDAGNSAELADAVRRVVQPLYRVIDENGEVVATGQVGGPSERVPSGTYTVKVLSEPVQTYENVVVEPGERTTVRMEPSGNTSAIEPIAARGGLTAGPGPPTAMLAGMRSGRRYRM